MKIKVFATLRPLVGGPEVEVDTGPGQTVGEALEELVRRYPQLKPELFGEDGQLLDRIHVFLTGRDIRYLEGFDTRIQEGDEMRIFPPVGGGRGVVLCTDRR